METDGLYSFMSLTLVISCSPSRALPKHTRSPASMTKSKSPSVSTHGHLPWKGDKPPFIVAGPNAVSGRIIHGGRLIDHAPTILRLLGLEPIGMDGHPVDALVRP